MPYEIHILSWTGSFLLAVCALPQAIEAKKDASSTRGLSWWFLWCWLLGELFTLAGLSQAVSGPVLCNYVFNTALIWYIMTVKRDQK